ncbi:MAG: AAA family ATPase [Anaerolineaceae bacterium]|jgi:MinD-like ATPase involved in chromosome partitioning or flagellar assembly|nr:AAA family ATPase [Anaerolineaceae bacterium]
MDAQWNNPTPNIDKQSSGDKPNILIGAEYQLGMEWFQNMTTDGRFRISNTKSTAQELVVTAQDVNPDAILLSPGMFSGPQELLDTIQRLQADVYLLLPATIDQETFLTFRELPNVKSVYKGQFNWPELFTAILSNTEAKRRFVSKPEGEIWRSTNAVSAGMYNIVVWGRAGGAGRTSVAVGLAETCAARGIKTLLISMAAPCPLPYILKGLKASKNISEWFARPSVEEGFHNAVQNYKPSMDVIVGLQDATREAHYMPDPATKATINDLSIMAARLMYGAVIIDAPVSVMAGAASAISAANYMVLVAQPTIADMISTVEAYRIVVKSLQGQHMIKPGNVVTVLNRVREGMMPQNEFHKIGGDFLIKQDVQSPFPITATTIKDDINVQIAQNDGTSVLASSQPFAQGMQTLSGMILGAVDKTGFSNNGNKPKKKLFGLIG